MLKIDCPWCGPRDETEFRCAGESRVLSGPPMEMTNAQWADHLFYRDNIKGEHEEVWCHQYGCGQWFNVVRDTRTHIITATYPLTEERPAAPDTGPGAHPEKGATITAEALAKDPYPLYAMLRRKEPVVWAPRLGAWLVSRHEDVRFMLEHPELFAPDRSWLLSGEHQGRAGTSAAAPANGAGHGLPDQTHFEPGAIAKFLQERIAFRVKSLINGFAKQRDVDLRAAFAARLPVLVMLDLLGLPDKDETLLRAWYESFEAAMAHPDAERRTVAEANLDAFHAYMQKHIVAARKASKPTLLQIFLAPRQGNTLSDVEIRRHAFAVFMGGITTVEAVLLNTLWALFQHKEALSRVREDQSRIAPAIEETIRWLSPVQAVTRHTVKAMDVGGVRIPKGAAVHGLLGAANRDEAVFADPDRFDLDRANLDKHLGFAADPSACLGRHLARAQARTALEALFEQIPDLALAEHTRPVGYPYRRSLELRARWTTPPQPTPSHVLGADHGH